MIQRVHILQLISRNSPETITIFDRGEDSVLVEASAAEADTPWSLIEWSDMMSKPAGAFPQKSSRPGTISTLLKAPALKG